MDGTVSFYTALTKTFTCVFDYTYFPFDTQKCSIIFGSWMYDFSQMDFQWSKTRPLNVNFEWLGSSMNRTRTSGWTLKNIRKYKKFWSDGTKDYDEELPQFEDQTIWWPLLHVEFTLERHRPYFALLELTPLILTSLLTLLCFGIDSEIMATGVLFANLIIQGLCSWWMIGQLPVGVGSVPKIGNLIAFADCILKVGAKLGGLQNTHIHWH
jgi:hypothetical protein